MPVLASFGAASAKNFGFSRRRGGYVGQAVYTTAGSYSMTVPTGATKMSVVMIYAGGYGCGGYYCGYVTCTDCCGRTIRLSVGAGGNGGIGGALRYKNCYAVVAGQTINITVGSPSSTASSVTVAGTNIGYDVNYSGGYGGGGVNQYSGGWNQPVYGTGGGGGNAAGYNGNGATGAYGTGTQGGSTSVKGTSPGGSPAAGGGGAGGSVAGYSTTGGGPGVCGAVRILFTHAAGPTRQFPSTNVGDL